MRPITQIVAIKTSSLDTMNPDSSFQKLRNILGVPLAERVRDGYQIPRVALMTTAMS
jgi:hypothetical protein